MTRSAAIAAAPAAFATLWSAAPASAQFYKGKTLTLIVNYGVGGNIDTEARILARHLPKHIPGAPTITSSYPSAVAVWAEMLMT